MYMQRYLYAVEDILKHEGGYVDHPNDPGGATNMGISLRWLKGLGSLDDADIDDDGDVDAADIKAITREKAIELYYKYFWTPARCYKIDSTEIATKVFDMCVNMGPRQTWKIVQRACGGLVIDGIVGPKTLERLNTLCHRSTLLAIQEGQRDFYLLLAKRKPEFQVFIRGWINRAAYPSTPRALGWT